MRTTFKVTAAVAVFACLILFSASSAFGAWELVKAFAFGADDWTRATYNEPSVDYLKVAQDTGLNWTYSAAQGHGYTNTVALDTSSNNRGLLSGDEEIYDQFTGAKLSAGPDPMLFRIDVDNGNYKFVGAGGDVDNANHGTIIRARDGDTGTVVTLVDDFLPTADYQFWTVEFEDKVVPPGDGTAPDPEFFPEAPCPLLTVTQGYIIIEQAVGSHPDGNGGDFCLLEVWKFKGADAGPDQTVYVGDRVTLSGAGQADATSFTWTQVSGSPTVTLEATADPKVVEFDTPALTVGTILTFELEVVSPSEGTTYDRVVVTILAKNAPQEVPADFVALIADRAYMLSWSPVLDADEYIVKIEVAPGFWFNLATTPDTQYPLSNLEVGKPAVVKVTTRNSFGEGVSTETKTLNPKRNQALLAPAGSTPPTGNVYTISHYAIAGMNDKIYNVNNDSWDGNAKSVDYWGYLWGAPLYFDQLVYFTGEIFTDGGWFTDLGVEYTKDGTTWIKVPAITLLPAYDFTNSPAGRADYARYDIEFPPVRGVAIRISGTPGGTATFTSIAELEAYGDSSVGPLVVYGVDLTFNERSTAVLDGSHSFSERGPLSGFSWVQTGGPTVAITGADQAKATFTAPVVDVDTVLTFEFTAGDGTDVATDEVSITVRNLVTTAVAGVDQIVTEGSLVSLDGTGSVSTTENITYTWTQVEGTEVTLSGANTATPSFTAPGIWGNVDKIILNLKVEDGVGGEGNDTMSVYVNNTMFFAPAEAGDMANDPWHLKSQDIYPAAPAIAGSSSYTLADNTYTVTANGNDIWGTNDQFRFLFLEVPEGVADFSVSVRVDGPPTGESWPDPWTKAGIMFRQDLDANSVDMYLIASRDNGIAMQYRNSKGASAARQGGAASQQPYMNGTNNFVGPVWLKLERQGDLFLGYYSYDGIRWLSGPWDYPTFHTIGINGPFYVGICLTSHTTASTGTAIFGDLRFKGAEGHVITDAYAIRTLEAGYEPGGPTNVSLSVRRNPDNAPDPVNVLEYIPAGLSAIPGSITHGGSVAGNNITWSLTGEGTTDVEYSLQVSGAVSGPINFSGLVSFTGGSAAIYGDSVVYEVPLAPVYLDVEMLIGGHLSWGASPSEGVAGYRVYSSVNGQPFMEIAFVTGFSYVDNSVVPGSTYNYKAAAVNVGGVEGPLSPATGEKMVVMEIREAEDYNYGGGQHPGYENCPAAVESPAVDDLGAGYDFFFATDIPVGDARRNYRPNDNCGIETVLDDGSTDVYHTNIGWITVGDWWRYGFDVTEAGWIRVSLRVAAPSDATAAVYWDEQLVGSVTFNTGSWHTLTDAVIEGQIQTTAGTHTLRVECAAGGFNLDKVGLETGAEPPKRGVIWEDHFEDYTNLYGNADLIGAGYTVVNGSGDANGAWRLWNTAGNDLGNEPAAITAMTDNFVVSDSDLAPDFQANEELITPAINCTDYLKVRLDFNKNFRVYTDDVDNLQVAEVDIRSSDDGIAWGSWINLYHYDSTTIPAGADPAEDAGAEQTMISQYADGKFIQIRGHFFQAQFDYWFALDDIVVTGELAELPPPPPAVIGPDGSLSWSPFGGGNYTVQYTDDLPGGVWNSVPGTAWPITATAWPGEGISGLPKRYYRVMSE